MPTRASTWIKQVYHSVTAIYDDILFDKSPYRIWKRESAYPVNTRKIVHVLQGLDRFAFRIYSPTSGTLWFVE